MASKSKKFATHFYSTPRSASSPFNSTGHTWFEEQADLENLNDQLLDRVRYLEAENDRLIREVQTTRESVTREVSNIKSKHDNELSEAKKLLDETQREKIRLQLDNERLWDETEELKASLTKKTKDLLLADKNNRVLETCTKDLTLKYSRLQADAKKAIDEARDLKRERDTLRKQVDESILRQTKEESLANVVVENYNESHNEEVSFKDQQDDKIEKKRNSDFKIVKSPKISNKAPTFKIRLRKRKIPSSSGEGGATESDMTFEQSVEEPKATEEPDSSKISAESPATKKTSFFLSLRLVPRPGVDSTRKPKAEICDSSVKEKKVKSTGGKFPVKEPRYIRLSKMKKRVQCDKCKNFFARKSVLIDHMRLHRGEKPYECEICKKCFTVKGNLINHMRVHTRERPFKCEICQQGFIQKAHLTHHMPKHDEGPFECEVCNKIFERKRSRANHMRGCHVK